MLLDEDHLLAWCGYKRPSDLRRFLEHNRIRYLIGKEGRICTTQAAVDAVLVAKSRSIPSNSEPLSALRM